ncbi:phosphoglycerate mutase-like protein [Setomelanomma holmii]|uniref:Phosphoglycerate mutase-like protein n=1 Tax=Setomelanomma holmii TaxID=210430 RepID=A0A9P4GXF7_9PLEO|nr:phosphoglycerate mutase-like protein [Setomelanomma holmii]
MSLSASSAHIYIVWHGEALHNVQRPYPHRDPPLTEAGMRATMAITLATSPDLIIISPMTRTIQTAINVFPSLQQVDKFTAPVQIWPELREANDATCNKSHSRAGMQSRFPQFDFSECPEQWNYPEHTEEGAIARAECVRNRLHGLSNKYRSIVVISHRGIIAFMVKGRRYNPAEFRSFRFATDVEAQDEGIRHGLNCDSLAKQDFGPTVLIPSDTLEPGEVVTSIDLPLRRGSYLLSTRTTPNLA